MLVNLLSNKITRVVTIGILAGTPLGSCLAEDSPATAAPDASTAIVVVQGDNVSGRVTLGGRVIPQKMVNLTAQMPGEVKFVAGEEGDPFTTGQQLVGLDTGALLAKRRAALAQLSSAQAAQQNAIVQYNQELRNPNAQSNQAMGGVPSVMGMFTDPMRSMMGRGNPKFDRHSAIVGQSTQLTAAINQVRQAQAGINELDESLANAVSRAPFDGVIINKMVEVGDIVQPGMPLVIFADTSRMQIQVDVPTRLLGRLVPGREVSARLDRGTESSVLVVARKFPSAEMGGHTTTVKFDLPAEVDAHSGMYAEVSIPDTAFSGSTMPQIPQSAIVWRGSLPGVFLVTESGRLKLKLVRTGPILDGGKVTVISGVKIGDRILKAPTAGTRSGTTIPVADIERPISPCAEINC